MLCGMLATWNAAKPFPNHILFSASPPSSSFSFGPDLERKGVRGKLYSKTNSYFSNHWVFSLSLGPFHWLSPYPFVIPLVGFSKCLQTAREIQVDQDFWRSCAELRSVGYTGLLPSFPSWVSIFLSQRAVCLTYSVWGREPAEHPFGVAVAALIRMCPVLSGVCLL